MIRHTFSSGRVRVAALLCAMAVAVLATVSSYSLRPPRLRPIVILARPVVPSPVARSETSSDELIESAIERDPFSVIHEPPAPALVASTSTTLAPAASTAESLRLVGTVVDSVDGSFVLCQLGSAATRVLRVGQDLGTYRLRSISQGSATFVSVDGQLLELRVTRTGT